MYRYVSNIANVHLSLIMFIHRPDNIKLAIFIEDTTTGGVPLTAPDPEFGSLFPPSLAPALRCQEAHVHWQAYDTAQHDIQPPRRCEAYGTRRLGRSVLRGYFILGPRRMCEYFLWMYRFSILINVTQNVLDGICI